MGKVGAGGVASDSATTIPVQSAVGLTNGNAYVITANRVNPTGNTKNPLSQTETFIGKLSGTNFINCVRQLEGQAQAWEADTVLEILVSATWANKIIEGVESFSGAITSLQNQVDAEHNPDGTHDDSIVTLNSATQTLTNKTFGDNPDMDGNAFDNLGGFSETVVPLTDGANVSLDASLGNIFTLSAGGNRTIDPPTNPLDGQKIIIIHHASGGARTLTLATGTGGFLFGSTVEDLDGATESGKRDLIGCVYSETLERFLVVAVVKGF